MSRWRRRWWHWPIHAIWLVIWVLLWPVRFVVGVFHEIWWALGSGWKRVGVGHIAGFLLWCLLYPFVELGRLIGWLFMSLLRWPQTVHFRFLLEGLPAVLMVCLLFYVFVLTGTTRTVDTYRRAAIRAFNDQDYETAMVYYKALVQMQPDDSAVRFELARTAHALGEYDRARALISSLARPTEQGYGPAHLWQAQQLLAGPMTPQALETAKAHLMRALRNFPKHAEAHETLGRIFLAQGQLKLAQEHYAKAVEGNPRARLMLARLQMLQGERDAARREAERAAEYFRVREADDIDAHDDRLGYADALAFLEQFQAAREVLLKGKTVSNDPRYAAALAQVYGLFAQHLQVSQRGNPAAIANLLKAAYLEDPNNLFVLMSMLRLLLSPEAGAQTSEMREAIRGLQAQRPQASILHYLLGLDAIRRGDQPSAQAHLSAAGQLDPGGALLVAGLGRSLVDEYRQPAQALALVDAGLRAWPSDPDLRHARGYMLMLRQDWREALPELELAVAQRPDDRNLHWALAEVCYRLGMTDKSRFHQRRMYGSVEVDSQADEESAGNTSPGSATAAISPQ